MHIGCFYTPFGEVFATGLSAKDVTRALEKKCRKEGINHGLEHFDDNVQHVQVPLGQAAFYGRDDDPGADLIPTPLPASPEATVRLQDVPALVALLDTLTRELPDTDSQKQAFHALLTQEL